MSLLTKEKQGQKMLYVSRNKSPATEIPWDNEYHEIDKHIPCHKAPMKPSFYFDIALHYIVIKL